MLYTIPRSLCVCRHLHRPPPPISVKYQYACTSIKFFKIVDRFERLFLFAFVCFFFLDPCEIVPVDRSVYVFL